MTNAVWRVRVLFSLALGTVLMPPAACPARAADGGWKVGVAAARITPDKPLVLLGYPNRAGAFTEVAGDLWAKALAFEDPAGHRAVIVTADLVGFQAHNTTTPVCDRLVKRTGLPRERFLFNASHTHTGPVVSLAPHRTLNVGHPAMTDVDAEQTAAYTRSLQDKLVGVVLAALDKLEPAALAWGAGEVGFPVSRRMTTPNGVVMAANPDGLTDRTVPVLRVTAAADGKLRAVLFGCACHNVAAGPANVIHGDYAGVAQALLQERHSGTVALFMAGCGGDANPQPMGSLGIARKHGETLADEVDRVLAGNTLPIGGSLSTELVTVDLPLQELSRQQIEAYLPLPNFQARTAAQMIAVLDAGETLPKAYAAPVAVWQIGESLTLVALPGEPVAEYVPLIRTALGGRKLWVAGFNNDCFGYLPTARVIEEGGHEAIGITLWAWGQDLRTSVGFLAPGVQDVIVNTVVDLAKTSP